MQTDAKVVQLAKAAPEHSSTSPRGRLPVALIPVRDKAVQQLKRSLQGLFDNADDTLFEMADRAASNGEQNAFFEAMRDLRLKRKSIERGFLQKILEAFTGLTQFEIGKAAPVLESVSFANLALMQTDVLEETVAVDAMVAKVLSNDGTALGYLTTRINSLISKKIDDKSNPLGPAQLCSIFLGACDGLGVEIRVKLIILKLFEKYVLAELQQLYAETNQLLSAAGVLPELKLAPPKRSASRAAAGKSSNGSPVAEQDDAGEEDVHEVFGTLQELLSQVRGTAFPQRAMPADAVPVSSNDLMRLLSHLQQHLAPQGTGLDVRDKLDQLLVRASAKSGKARVVGQVDDDVINLVSMLFEFILDDRNLPDSMKALIARLQIPMLKVAVQDKTFFSRGSHPARRLLNEIASAALGWADQDDEKRDSLYQKIEQIVQCLLNDYVDDSSLFSELLADFMAFTGGERRRSDLLEQRTKDAEEGRAKSDLARIRVEQELNSRLVGKTLPEVIVRLLQDAWSKVMLLTCLKHGDESEQWASALSVIDDLVWSVEPHEDDPSARLSLLELVPNLLKALREGMTEAALDPFVAGEYFTQLEALHVQVFQRFKREMPVAPLLECDDLGAESPVLLADVPGEISDEVQALAAHEAVEEEVFEPPVMVEVIEEIILLAPGEIRSTEPETLLPDDDAALQQVDDLRVGSWVELQETEEHKLRCKLAAIIKPTGKYIFVNRTGMKVLEKTRMGLAVEFRRGAVRMLDDALLFDRALESVIGNLRRLKST